MSEENPIVKVESTESQPWKRRTEEVRLANEFVSGASLRENPNLYSNFWRRFFAHILDCLILSTIVCAIGALIGQNDANLIKLVGATHSTVLWAAVGFYGSLACLFIPGLPLLPAAAGILCWICPLLSTQFAASYPGYLIFTIPFVLDFVYRTQSESSAVRATLGKRLMGIYVADEQGNRLTLGNSLRRNIARNFAIPAFVLRPITARWSQSKQTVYDSGSSTVVLRRLRGKTDSTGKTDSSIKKLGF